MEIRLLENPQEMRCKFVEHFVMSWEEFQVRQRDWIAQMAERNNIVDLAWYEQQMFLWDRMNPASPSVSFQEALALLRAKKGEVLFLTESEPFRYPGELLLEDEAITGFVAQADAGALADLISEDWYGLYSPLHHPMVLPQDLYVFDESMEWALVFTHETWDWESELVDAMKAAESRCCIAIERK